VARVLHRSYRVTVAAQTLDYVASGMQAKMRRSQLDGLVALFRDRGTPIPKAWLTGETDGLPFLPLNSLGLIDLQGTGEVDPPGKPGATGWKAALAAPAVALALNGLLARVHAKAGQEFPPRVATAVVAAVANWAADTASHLYDARRPLGAPTEWIDGITAVLAPWLEGRGSISTVALADLTPKLFPKWRQRLLKHKPKET